MRLADFISTHGAVIVAEAVVYARTLPPLADEKEELLQNHIPKILDAIVLDLRQTQSPDEAHIKAQGDAPLMVGGRESAAETHGRLRARSGVTTTQLVAEYRALRASVLRLWSEAGPDNPSIAEVVRFNEAIDQAIAESIALYSEEMEQLRNVFLGVLGHDLRGPLNAILLTSQLISRLAKDPNISGPLGTLIRSGRRMASLLDTLLEYNKSTLGTGMLVKRVPVDLAPECAAEVEVLSASLPQATVRLTCTGDLHGNFDASRLREAVANLVSNAASYGDAEPIFIEVSDLGEQVSLKVMNTGSDIPQDQVRRLFEPMARGVDTASQRTNLGLGLFIVEEIARAHGGGVTCTSGSGTTVFELLVPRDLPARN